MAKIRKRGNSYQIDYFDPNGKRVRRAYKKRKDAEAELSKRVSLIAEGRYLDVKEDNTTTLKELIDKYTENFRDQASFRTCKRFCLADFREYFGEETRLVNIRYVNLETYRNHLKQKPTKKGTVRQVASINRAIATLHHLLEKGVEWEMLDQNPFGRGKSLLMKENNKRLRFLMEDEINRLLDECPKYLNSVVKCALNTGMRKGEILSLKWSQIRNGFIYLQKTKTNEPRQVPINDDLKETFSRIRAEEGLESEYVFTFRRNEDKLIGLKPVRKRKKSRPLPQPVKHLKGAFESALRRAGIQDFRFHDLRHTFASHAIMRGASLKEVQEVLGHKTMTMTLRYAHLSQEHKKRAVNLLNGLTTSVTKLSHFQKRPCKSLIMYSYFTNVT